MVGFHAFSGNDYVSSFFKKSKRTCDIVKTNEEFIDLFCNLGEGPMTDEIYTGLEKFVCTIYNEKKFQTVNEARSALFWKKLWKNKKVTDISLIPPCASSLMKHSNRAHYVTKMWKQAVMPLMNIGDPSSNGWLPDGRIDWIDKLI